jgi:Protein of unknown function (DUF2848)
VLNQLTFDIGGARCTAGVDALIVAGWTGRDKAAVDLHIAELAGLGVKPPRSVPCFYRVGANLLTGAPVIDVAGSDSSGEVEFVLVSLADGLHVGVGSDHTDRKFEAHSVTVAKQMCPKPVSGELWNFADVEGHWDELVLRSWVTRQGKRELYQEGPVTRLLAPRDLMARYLGTADVLPIGTAMYGGTLPVHGVIGGGERFEIELDDPRLSRKLRHAYEVRCLEVAD